MFQTLMADGVNAALGTAGSWLVAITHIAAPVAIAALWQGAVIALVLWVCLGLTPRVRIYIGAAQRFALWAAAFAVVVGLELLPWLMHGALSVFAVNGPFDVVAPRARFEFDDRWTFAIAALWLGASLVRAVNLASQSLRLRRLWTSASPVVADAKLRELLSTASQTRRPIELCTTRRLDRPSVIGFLAPRILIPEWLFDRLTPGELEQVVLHEAEHLRRRDDWTNLFQKLVLVLFPLNPALAWIERRLCREREMACDEGVVRRTQAPRAYAECLTSLAERRLELQSERRRAHALSLGAFERRPELVRRVYSILARKQALHPMAARALVSVVGCGLLVASVELARCPQMVAFVPTAQTATVQTQMARAASMPQLGDGDRASVQPTAGRDNSGFRVVDAKAVLPAGHGISPVTSTSTSTSRRRAVRPSAEPASALQPELASINADGPREVLLRAETPDADAGARGQNTNSGFAPTPRNVVPRYVVLTAWEEVRTSPRNARIIADYDVNTAAQAQSSNAADPNGGETITRITVTRLIIAVYPMSFGPNGSGLNSSGLNGSGPGTKPAHAQDSGRPPASSPESGWLVFQL